MIDQGYSYGIISVETGLSTDIIKRRAREYIMDRQIEQMEMTLPTTAGKYDHLFEEKMNEGRFYSEYKK
jgi:uncharacterized protein YerC